MRVLWHSHAPWAPTGYGQQTALFASRLQRAGYDIAISASYGLAGGLQFWNGLTVLPGDWGDQLGYGALLRNYRLWKPDLIITLGDVSPGPLADLPVASFAPIEFAPLPEPTRRYFADTGAIPLAVTRDGERLLREAGFDPLYVPHGVNTAVFRPQDRTEARQQLGLPEEAFIVGMVATNRTTMGERKSFPESLEAFARFQENHPDARLLLHTNVQPWGGTDLLRLADKLGIADALTSPDEDKLDAGLLDASFLARTPR